MDLPETVTEGSQTHSITYDQAARPLQETMPNGVKVNYEFDQCGRLTLLENMLNQRAIAKAAYTYDANGNRISITDENNQVTEYAYNEAKRCPPLL